MAQPTKHKVYKVPVYPQTYIPPTEKKVVYAFLTTREERRIKVAG